MPAGSTWGQDQVAAEQEQFIRALEDSFNAELTAGMLQLLRTGMLESAKVLKEIARLAERGVAAAQFEQAHRTIATAAQRAILFSYDQTVTARRQGSMRGYDYRRAANNPKNIRYAGGKLREALGSPQMWEADSRGIKFINTDWLDSRARHWARLNAGAGGRGSGSRRSFEVEWGGMVVASLGLDMSASPSFMVPRGYWIEPGVGPVSPGALGTAAFFPLGEGPYPQGKIDLRVDRERLGRSGSFPLQRQRLSRGIEARNFLDAGVARLARDLGPTYERMYGELWRSKVATVRPSVQHYRVRTFRSTVPAA